MDAVELDPAQELVRRSRGAHASRTAAGVLAVGDARRRARASSSKAPGTRRAVLLEARDAIEATAARLPYVGGF